MEGERESSREKRDGKRIEAKTPPNRDFDLVYKEKTNYPCIVPRPCGSVQQDKNALIS